MDEKTALLKVLEHVRDYGANRAEGVARGVETPRLAAVMVQKYGQGTVDAVRLIFGNRAAREVMLAVDRATDRIDPDWRAHERERWMARPADLVAHQPGTYFASPEAGKIGRRWNYEL